MSRRLRLHEPNIHDCTGIMGMPVTVHIADPVASPGDIDAVFAYLRRIDRVFSTYKPDSETEQLNRCLQRQG